MFTRLLSSALCVVAFTVGRAEAQFSVGPSTVPAEDFRIELGAMLWTPTPEISINADALAPLGSVDFVQEFGIEDKRFTELRAVLKLGRKHKLRFSRTPFRYSADATLQRTISFGGRTFFVGLPAHTDIEWDLLRGGYEWDFVSLSHGFVGFVTELKYNTVTATISSPLLGSATAEQKAPVPTFGGIARGYIGSYVSLTGEFTGLSIDRSEFRGKFYDLDVYGTVHLGRHVGAQVGYRSITVDYLVDSDEGDLKMKGPYFGGIVRF